MYTTIKKPSDYFNTKLYTGTGSSQSITGVNFQPDWSWFKVRSEAGSHRIVDSVRGNTKYLFSNATDAEATDTNNVTSFDSDGFSLGTGSINESARTYASWNWLANGTGVSNTDGTISSTVSANTTSGFSIVSYTGNATSGATIGHGLGVAPRMIIVKKLNGSFNWGIYHKDIGATKVLAFTTGSPDQDTSYWNDTEPTSSVFSVGNGGLTNGSGSTMIAYCFADVQGFSKMGSYTGNGSADGPFCFNGFSPSFVMIKRSDMNSSGRWVLWDNKRNTFNLMDNALFPNSSAVENDGYWKIDGLSNGFKIRDPEVEMNSNGGFYTYMAFAEEPLVGDNPATAR